LGFHKEILQNLSRRDFIKWSGSASLSLFLLPLFEMGWRPYKLNSPDELSHQLGRIISPVVDVYNRPSLDARLVTTLWQDSVRQISSVTIGGEKPSYNRIWYEMGNSGFVHSGAIQPVDIQENPIVQSIPEEGRLAEITVPFTDAVWHPKSPHLVTYRLYYGTVYWIYECIQDQNSKFWYRIADDKWDIEYYVDARHMHLINPEDISPLSSHVPESEKRIEIRLAEQAVIAYEFNQPVFLARTATGARFIDGDYRTEPGNYITNRKRPSRHMAAGDPAAPNSYDLPGIPWICYITEKGVSFHGTYWHNDFGKPRSHGCINLTPDDALWFYRWTNPEVPVGNIIRNARNGTRVKIF
jgi:hypothetical protein